MIEGIERTVVIIKPDAVEKRLVGKIVNRIEKLGLVIMKIKMKRISKRECKKLYPKTRQNLPEIYAAVENYLTEKPSIILIVEGEDAVQKVRAVRGPTNLLQAPEGTIRRDFITDEERELFEHGKNVKNLMHAPDDEKEARFTIKLFFGIFKQ